MRELDVDHLIIGAGLLGLAITDHLLRRGAQKVLLVDRERDLARASYGARELALSTGLAEYAELEDRGKLLLEEWGAYLQRDPSYHRCGSLQLPVMLEPDGADLVEGEALRQRAPGLVVEDDDVAIFHGLDGSLDGSEVKSGLLAQIRERGGTILTDCEALSFSLMDDHWAFALSSRGGHARRIYLSAGSSNPALLRSAGVECHWRVSAHHTFEFECAPRSRGIVRLEGARPSVVYEDGDGGMQVILVEDPEAGVVDPLVNWRLLEVFRARERSRYPSLAEARVHRGSAEHRLDLDPEAPGILSAHDGRLLAAGAFGLNRLPLALAVAEQMASRGSESPGL